MINVYGCAVRVRLVGRSVGAMQCESSFHVASDDDENKMRYIESVRSYPSRTFLFHSFFLHSSIMLSRYCQRLSKFPDCTLRYRYVYKHIPISCFVFYIQPVCFFFFQHIKYKFCISLHVDESERSLKLIRYNQLALVFCKRVRENFIACNLLLA